MKNSKMIFMAMSFVAILGYASAMSESEERIDTAATQVAEEPAAPVEAVPVAEVPVTPVEEVKPELPVQEAMPVAEESAAPVEVEPVAPVEDAKPVETVEPTPADTEPKSQDEADMEDFFKDLMIDENEGSNK